MERKLQKNNHKGGSMSYPYFSKSENRLMMASIAIVALLFCFFAAALCTCALNQLGMSARQALIFGSLTGFIAVTFSLCRLWKRC